jgi:hypothetical protein
MEQEDRKVMMTSEDFQRMCCTIRELTGVCEKLTTHVESLTKRVLQLEIAMRYGGNLVAVHTTDL